MSYVFQEDNLRGQHRGMAVLVGIVSECLVGTFLIRQP